GNPNTFTISIEHVNDSANSTPLSPAQQAASFALIAHICERYGIPKRAADTAGGVTGHYSIDPVNRARCPGVYPWAALWAALEGKVMWTQQSDGG
ncbi:MAG TPA: N-acetylmuramoyl-L-alanine amidase, partial [Ktedonobacterales bacterium]|nr:N-acetylmuramoyl-L-alanine amidase [Ktedonobacterales bacterium]